MTSLDIQNLLLFSYKSHLEEVTKKLKLKKDTNIEKIGKSCYNIISFAETIKI